MRDIEFRGWIKDEKKMCKVERLWFPMEPWPMCSIVLDQNRTFGADEVELMEFTGLCDKNGKEIYEGDIVANYNYKGEIHTKGTVTYSTGFNIGCNGFEYDQLICGFHCGEECLTDSMISNDVFIIGNIHENPELLES